MITGGCLCGAARFVVDGELLPVQLCHSRRCRKATGADFAPEVAVAAEDFRWMQGAELVSIYEAPLLYEPPPYRRGFCRICGSPLPVVEPDAPFVTFLAGVLDELPELRPLGRVLCASAEPTRPDDRGEQDLALASLDAQPCRAPQTPLGRSQDGEGASVE